MRRWLDAVTKIGQDSEHYRASSRELVRRVLAQTAEERTQNRSLKLLRTVTPLLLIAVCLQSANAQASYHHLKSTRLPVRVLDRFVNQHDPATGKSRLPWIDQIFRQQGASVRNFYTRGISLSNPSWSLLDTGQHLDEAGVPILADRYSVEQRNQSLQLYQRGVYLADPAREPRPPHHLSRSHKACQ